MKTLAALLLLCPFLFAESPSKELIAAKDPQKKYFLIGETAESPKKGFGLVIIMPGGDGSADFKEFVNSIHEEALPKGYLAVQAVAVKWTKDQQIVWPTEIDRTNVDKLKFTTEELVDAIVVDVMKDYPIDPRRVFTLTWSSSGPAAYALSVTNPKITGSFIAMSVFNEGELKLDAAKGKPYFLYHSPDDRVCRYSFAEKAKKTLGNKGAKVTLVDYDGGHGWTGATMDDIRTGIQWLEQYATAPKK
jgi:predicted esterase